jgi:hypothetical protein
LTVSVLYFYIQIFETETENLFALIFFLKKQNQQKFTQISKTILLDFGKF